MLKIPADISHSLPHTHHTNSAIADSTTKMIEREIEVGDNRFCIWWRRIMAAERECGRRCKEVRVGAVVALHHPLHHRQLQ